VRDEWPFSEIVAEWSFSLLLLLLFLLCLGSVLAHAEELNEKPYSPQSTSLNSSEQIPTSPSPKELLQDFKNLIDEWGMDSEQLSKELERLLPIVSEQENSIQALSSRLKSLESSLSSERETAKASLVNEQNKTGFWRIVSIVGGAVSASLALILVVR